MVCVIFNLLIKHFPVPLALAQAAPEVPMTFAIVLRSRLGKVTQPTQYLIQLRLKQRMTDIHTVYTGKVDQANRID